MEEVSRLIYELQEGQENQRRNAAIRLGRVRDDRVVQPLINALLDKSEMVQVSAIQSLSWIQDSQMVEPLMERARTTTEKLVLNHALEVLLRLNFEDYPNIRSFLQEMQYNPKVDGEIKEAINSKLNGN